VQIDRPKTRRGKKHLENRSSKVIENDKMTLLLKGGKTSETVTGAMAELHAIKKPMVQQLREKNPMYPFEDETKLIRFAEKLDSSLLLYGSNSKKHRDSLVFSRMFDRQLLDMVELQITKFQPSSQFETPGCNFGTKPCVILQGPLFESDETLKRIGNLMVDWFRGVKVSSLRLQGLEMVISLTAISEKEIQLRVYRTVLKKSGTKTPRVELIEKGPMLDFSVGRTKLASDDLLRAAMKKPKELTVKPRNKNISHDVFGSKVAQIHLGRQKAHSIPVRKVRALKRDRVFKTAKGEQN